MSVSEMRYNPLGGSGLKVSALSLGGWTTYGASIKDNNVIRNIITTAYDAGINFFDIADIYGRGEAEIEMGRVLKDLPRHELVISSKVFWPMSEDINDRGLSRKHIMESVERSLKRIGTDYLDMYFCHRYDAQTPIEETQRAMDDLVHQGKVLYWGTSEWTAEQLEVAHALSDMHNYYRPQVEQPQYSLLYRRIESEIVPLAEERAMGLVVWSPLASGLLTGKYDEGIPEGSRLARIEWLRERVYQEDTLRRIREFKTLADELGCSRAQLALAWAASSPYVSSVITGATSVEQVHENLGALTVALNDSVRARLDVMFPADRWKTEQD